MRWLRFAGLLCFATVLQAGLLAYLDIKPDLLLILLVFFAVYSNTTEAIITSFSIGFAADIIGPAMGPQIISFGLCGTGLAYLNRVIAIKKIPYQALAIFITGLLAGTSAHFLTYIRSGPAVQNFLFTLLGTSFYSAVIGPFLFLPTTWWMSIKTKRFRKY